MYSSHHTAIIIRMVLFLDLMVEMKVYAPHILAWLLLLIFREGPYAGALQTEICKVKRHSPQTEICSIRFSGMCFAWIERELFCFDISAHFISKWNQREKVKEGALWRGYSAFYFCIQQIILHFY